MTAADYKAFVRVFAPFAGLLALANLTAEAGQVPLPGLLDSNPYLSARLAGNLTFARTVYSAWLMIAFAVPAVGLFFLYDLRTAPPAVYRYWRLFWGFGFLAYAVHAYLATGDWFGWDFAQIFRRQGFLVAGTNYLLLLLWGVEVGVAVARGQAAGKAVWFYRFQWVVHLLFVAAAVVATVVFFSVVKTAVAFALGVAVLAVAGLALLARFFFGPPAAPAAGGAS